MIKQAHYFEHIEYYFHSDSKMCLRNNVPYISFGQERTCAEGKRIFRYVNENEKTGETT